MISARETVLSRSLSLCDGCAMPRFCYLVCICSGWFCLRFWRCEIQYLIFIAVSPGFPKFLSFLSLLISLYTDCSVLPWLVSPVSCSFPGVLKPICALLSLPGGCVSLCAFQHFFDFLWCFFQVLSLVLFNFLGNRCEGMCLTSVFVLYYWMNGEKWMNSLDLPGGINLLSSLKIPVSIIRRFFLELKLICTIFQLISWFHVFLYLSPLFQFNSYFRMGTFCNGSENCSVSSGPRQHFFSLGKILSLSWSAPSPDRKDQPDVTMVRFLRVIWAHVEIDWWKNRICCCCCLTGNKGVIIIRGGCIIIRIPLNILRHILLCVTFFPNSRWWNLMGKTFARSFAYKEHNVSTDNRTTAVIPFPPFLPMAALFKLAPKKKEY